MNSNIIFDKTSSQKLSILITGHRGYIGSALMELLKDKYYIGRIIGYDIIDGDDILDEIKLSNIMILNKIDLVIHLAALSSVSACMEDSALADRINVRGTYSVLNAMKISGCKNIIYASTSSVYGDNKHLPYREDQDLNPCSPYGTSKLLGEYAILEHYRLNNIGNYLIFRMFNVVGTSGFKDIDSMSNPGYDRLFAGLQSGKITIYGKDYETLDGTCERDYVSLKDVCLAYIKGIKTIYNGTLKLQLSQDHNLDDLWNFGRNYTSTNQHSNLDIINKSVDKIQWIINICSGKPLSVKCIITEWDRISSDIQDNIDKYPGCNQLPQISYTYGKRREGDPAKVYGLNDRARHLIGWTPIRKIDDIILDLAFDKKL